MRAAGCVTGFRAAGHVTTRTAAAFALVTGVSELLTIQVLLPNIVTSIADLTALRGDRERACDLGAALPLTGHRALPACAHPTRVRGVRKRLSVSVLFPVIQTAVASAAAILEDGV